jgi:hypothetical protein
MPARRQARLRQGAVFTLLWLAPGVAYRLTRTDLFAGIKGTDQFN